MTTPALLLIADISGFTQFMRLHALATSHARQIVVRLLRALVDAAEPPLVVAELEGDAVFFYALADPAKDGDLEAVAERVKPQIVRFYQAFEREVEALAGTPLCVCEACLSVRDLRLKQVAHAGEVALEKVGRFEKLFGIDVIVVHRLLKNDVPAHDYLLLTAPALAAAGGFYGLEPERRRAPFEGVGEVEMGVFYRDALAPVLARPVEAAPAPAPRGVLGWKLKMHARALGELLGLRRAETPRSEAPALSLT
jgi:hypothetical protein